GVEQVGEDGAVVHQRLAQLLGAGLAPLPALEYVVRVAVVAQRPGVLDGQVGELVVEVRGGVAPRLDQPRHQVVAGDNGRGRVLDELRLYGLPLLREPVAVGRVQGT